MVRRSGPADGRGADAPWTARILRPMATARSAAPAATSSADRATGLRGEVRVLVIFKLAARPTPGAWQIERALEVLASSVPGLVRRRQASDPGTLVRADRPTGTALFPRFLLEGEVDGPDGGWELYVGHVGSGVLVKRRAISLATLADAEPGIIAEATPLLRAVAAAGAVLRAQGLADPWGRDAIMAGEALWVNRLVVSDETPSRIHENLEFAVPMTATDGRIGLVARSASLLFPEHAEKADDVIVGLVAATEEWLMVDDITRALGAWVRDLEAAEPVLARTQAEVRGASIEVIARRALIDERTRYLRNGAAAARVAAREAWGVDAQVHAMDDRLAGMRHLVEGERVRRQATRDERRNELLFVFTLLAALQTTFVVFDFVTGSDYVVPSAIRVAIGVALAIVGAVLVIGAVRREGLASDPESTPADPPDEAPGRETPPAP